MSSGIKKFVDYTSLPAFDINEYLMNQTVMVFASSAARTSAFTAAGVTITEGMVTYLMDTNLTQYYDGAAWISYATAAGVVTSLTGTANQITVSASTGAVTLSLPSAVSIAGTMTAYTGTRTITLGAWTVTGTWAAVQSTNGYLLLGNTGSDNAIYLRTGAGNVNIGAADSNTLQVGNGSSQHNGTFTVTSQLNVSGNLVCSNRYMGTAPNNGAFLQMRSGNATSFNWDGSYQFIVDSTHVKTFVIQHPTKPDNFLVHACTEGATADVFYRGQAQLKAGICVVTLPDYFEELTELDGRSVMLTPIADQNGVVANLAAYEIEDGQFLVEQIGGYHVPDQRFWWRVDAVRKNTTFNVEPEKSTVSVRGEAPYTYIESNA